MSCSAVRIRAMGSREMYDGISHSSQFPNRERKRQFLRNAEVSMGCVILIEYSVRCDAGRRCR